MGKKTNTLLRVRISTAGVSLPCFLFHCGRRKNDSIQRRSGCHILVYIFLFSASLYSLGSGELAPPSFRCKARLRGADSTGLRIDTYVGRSTWTDVFFPVMDGRCFALLTLLRGTVVNRTYSTHENLYMYPLFLTILGPIYCGPPQ